MLADGRNPFSKFTSTGRTADEVNAAKVAKAARLEREEQEATRKALNTHVAKIKIRETSRVISTVKLPAKPTLPENVCKCVKCGVEINPGLSYKARVYTGHIKVNVDKARLVSVNPEVQYEEYTERIPFAKFTTGFVCDRCASDYGYTTVVTRKGTEEIPNVVTLPRPEMEVPNEKTPAARRGFSTKMHIRGAVRAHRKDNYFEK
jgi:hypothetical protein